MAQKIATAALVAGLAAAIYGIVRAGESAEAAKSKANKAAAAQVVDQSPLKTARQLAALADTPEEQALAKEALRLGDYELDLAFDIALRDADAHPPELTREAKDIQARLQKAQKLQQTLQAQVTLLTAELAKASGDRKEALDDQQSLAKSSLDLANNEVGDAELDLTNAGGNQRGRIEQLKRTHEEAGHGKEAEKSFPAAAPEELGLIHRYQQWSALLAKKKMLLNAKAEAESAVAAVVEQHSALEAQNDAEKFNSPDLAAHSSLAEADASAGAHAASANTVAQNLRRTRSHAESREALATAKAIANDQQNLASLDKRADNEKELVGIYSQWMGLVSVRQSNVMKRMLIGVAIILGVFLIGVFFNTWMEKLLDRLRLDRRQVQNLRTVTRVTLRVVALLLILLVIFGPPGQLGTFLGLAGAGLTVALKDFILGFFGWFVLMGRNGIRVGDWVEINGVAGEVVEIGLLKTILLETGNWTDAGHPTGRRVSFVNSFAIEGHFFNFTTSGQWMWDELQLSIPGDQNPYGVIDGLQKLVTQETEENAHKAEAEWSQSTTHYRVKSFSAEPAISVKPSGSGVEVGGGVNVGTVTYIW